MDLRDSWILTCRQYLVSCISISQLCLPLFGLIFTLSFP